MAVREIRNPADYSETLILLYFELLLWHVVSLQNVCLDTAYWFSEN